MKTKRIINYLDKTANALEIVIAFVLLVIIAIKVIEMIAGLAGFDLIILTTDWDSILSTAFILVIGVEFTKMLCKHTPETVIDVLLFALARQTVLYHESTTDMMIGVFAIAGLFAAKKFLVDKIDDKKQEGI